MENDSIKFDSTTKDNVLEAIPKSKISSNKANSFNRSSSLKKFISKSENWTDKYSGFSQSYLERNSATIVSHKNSPSSLEVDYYKQLNEIRKTRELLIDEYRKLLHLPTIDTVSRYGTADIYRPSKVTKPVQPLLKRPQFKDFLRAVLSNQSNSKIQPGQQIFRN